MKLLSIYEAAFEANIPASRIRRAIKRGHLEATMGVKPDSKREMWLIEESDLEHSLRKRAMTTREGRKVQFVELEDLKGRVYEECFDTECFDTEGGAKAYEEMLNRKYGP